MGSGKSKLGRTLSEFTGYRLVDLDKFIEERYFATIPELFEKFGEVRFREIEHSVLLECSEFEKCIISTGGGAPCFYDNMNIMLSTGTTLFLDIPEEVLFERIVPKKFKRPLIADLTDDQIREFISQSLAKRLPYYEQAHIRLNTADRDADFVVKHIEEYETSKLQ